jgi:selenocysteine lyase/cysteine desulfurase
VHVRCRLTALRAIRHIPANDTPAELNEGHTWAALDMEAKHTPSVVRASPHYFNTLEQIDLLADVIDHLTRSPS